jgi:hypothetical protein
MNSKQLKELLRGLKCYSETAANQWLKQHPSKSYSNADLGRLLAFLRSRREQGESKRCRTVAEAIQAEKQRQGQLPRKSRQLSVWS